MKKIDLQQKIKENNDNNLTMHEQNILDNYRKLSEENKLTIDILINRLLKHEKGER